MLWFKKQKESAPQFPPEQYEPVVRCSICTGEKVACMRDRTSGRLQEIMLIRAPQDLDEFCRRYGVERDKIREVY